jgi:hypothetical protein
MNGDWFGDSYDIVKRFFVSELQLLGYTVYVDPMPSGEWDSVEPQFLKFLGAVHIRDEQASRPSALLLDPDTGIAEHRSRAHASISSIVLHLGRHEVVFVFDQSFSRATATGPQLREKLQRLRSLGAGGFYYDSHARFLFASRSAERLNALRDALVRSGLPSQRLVALDQTDATSAGSGL